MKSTLSIKLSIRIESETKKSDLKTVFLSSNLLTEGPFPSFTLEIYGSIKTVILSYEISHTALTKYFNSTTNTEKFKVEMEKVSGFDLDKFFDQWLYKGGMLIIDSDWKYNEKNSEIEISMDQVQDDGYLFDMPIEIMLTFENKSSKIESIQLDKKTKKFIISSENKPKEIKIDPSVKLLARWSINELK